MCLHNAEHVHPDSRGSTGGNAESAATHAAERATGRREAESEAIRSTRSTWQCVCVFFLEGGFEPPFPYHTAICSRGGGFQPRFPDHKAIGQRCGIFFCETPPVRLCGAQTGHYMSERHHTPLLYSQETGIFTTYCDATSPAPVEKKSPSALKLPKAEPAKRAPNSDAPGIRRGPAIGFPDSVPRAGRRNNLTPHPPAPLRRVALNFCHVAMCHLALGCRLLF